MEWPHSQRATRAKFVELGNQFKWLTAFLPQATIFQCRGLTEASISGSPRKFNGESPFAFLGVFGNESGGLLLGDDEEVSPSTSPTPRSPTRPSPVVLSSRTVFSILNPGENSASLPLARMSQGESDPSHAGGSRPHNSNRAYMSVHPANKGLRSASRQNKCKHC